MAVMNAVFVSVNAVILSQKTVRQHLHLPLPQKLQHHRTLPNLAVAHLHGHLLLPHHAVVVKEQTLVLVQVVFVLAVFRPCN